MIVADTNLIAYSIIAGEHTAAAERLLARDPAWAAPVLWRSELRNILATNIRTGRLTLDLAKAFMSAAEQRMRELEHDVPSDAVLECAAESGLTAYDCEFVVLASQLGVPLLTADRRLVRAFPKVARLLT